MKDLLIGVIGSGGRGALARYAHRPGEGSRVVACCDIRDDVLEANRGAYGADLFTTHDPHELLTRDLDAVFVSTPDFLHEEHAVAALEAGRAVYLEKPMAITATGCDRILRAAMESGARLYVGHNMRHMPFVEKMKRLIDEGAIGQVKAVWCRHFVGNGGDYYFKDWHAQRRYATGMLLQKAAHDIDVIHWLADSYTRRVNDLGGLVVYNEALARHPESAPGNAQISNIWPPLAQTGLNPAMDIEDISMMQMEMQNGVFAAYQQCHFTPDYWRNYTVIGTAGRIENFGNGEPGTVIRLWNQRTQWKDAGDATFEVGEGEGEGGHGGSDPAIVAEFLRFVREGGATQTSPMGARYSVVAGCAATDSLRDGGMPRDVPRPAPEIEAHFSKSP